MEGPQATENRQPAEKENTEKKKPVREILFAALLAAVIFVIVIFGLQMTTGTISWLPFGNKSPALQQDNPDRQQTIVSRLTSPLFIAAGDGSGIFHAITPETDLTTQSNGTSAAGRLLLISVKDYLSKGAVVERITHEQFKKAASKETITAQYSCGISFEEFMDFNRLRKPSGSTVQYLSRLILSAKDDGSMFLYDGKKDRYYRIKGNRKNVLTGDFVKGLAETISDNSEQQFYANNSTWLGDRELLPENAAGTEEAIPQMVPPSQNFPPEYSAANTEDLSSLEALFFPEGMDFIQKVKTSDGSLIYMYGSMEKMLRVNSTGGFTFTQESGAQSPVERLKIFSTALGFYDSLTLVSDYIGEHGGWPSEANENTMVRLISSEKLEKGNEGLLTSSEKGYRFTFALEMAGFPLTYQKGTQLTVELYGKEVTVYHRDLPDLSSLLQTSSNVNDTTEPPEEGDPTQNSTSSDASGTVSEESDATAAGKKSAFFSGEGAALNLKTVIQNNSTILTDVLNEEKTDHPEILSDNGEDPVTAEDLFSGISAADLQLLRIDTANGNSASSARSSGSSASDSMATGYTEGAFSSTGNENWVLAPAWRIRVGGRSLWFHAQTGALLQS